MLPWLRSPPQVVRLRCRGEGNGTAAAACTVLHKPLHKLQVNCEHQRKDELLCSAWSVIDEPEGAHARAIALLC